MSKQMEDFMSDKQVAQREAGHPWLRARTVMVRDREYVSLDDAIEYAETRAIPIEQIAAAMADPLVGPLVNAMLTVHVNDGSAHDRAMAWSEGHTAGYDEALAEAAAGPRDIPQHSQHSPACAGQDDNADCICGVSDAYALGLRDGAAGPREDGLREALDSLEAIEQELLDDGMEQTATAIHVALDPLRAALAKASE